MKNISTTYKLLLSDGVRLYKKVWWASYEVNGWSGLVHVGKTAARARKHLLDYINGGKGNPL